MQNIKKILLATDFSDTAGLALEHAAMLAGRNNAELHVLHVNVEAVQVYGLGGLPLPTEITPEVKEAAEKHIESFTSKVEIPVVTAVEWGFSASIEVNKYASEHGVDLIVLGTHARTGIRRFFLGSVAAEVLRTATRPVLIVGPDQKLSGMAYRHIVVGVDFSTPSKEALETAGCLAAKNQTLLSALHVIDSATLPPYYPNEFADADQNKARDSFAEALAGMSLPVPVDKVIVTGTPYLELVKFANEHEADLMVVAATGLGKIDQWLLGSVTERVVRSAPCSVLVYRAPEKDSG